ncbi:hypothetical protein FJT64_011860 [Amphibalanus amphitrite]|uniref:Uncharacterized protein n=1 Tax=Amphibalanus amphitrite TaxID=1232801 RepID=A0A6A4V9W8_AMPAM|nr:hypothetical protein FJT64_011860 [Amphibalanus amphitrite]
MPRVTRMPTRSSRWCRPTGGRGVAPRGPQGGVHPACLGYAVGLGNCGGFPISATSREEVPGSLPWSSRSSSAPTTTW